MCKFFSLLSDGRGKMYYLDAGQRVNVNNADSHTTIVDWYKNDGQLSDKNTTEDGMNKYEYNPLTREFTIDQLNNTRDDSKIIEQLCNKLDFKTIVPELIIKPIVHPFTKNRKRVTPKDIELLQVDNAFNILDT